MLVVQVGPAEPVASTLDFLQAARLDQASNQPESAIKKYMT